MCSHHVQPFHHKHALPPLSLPTTPSLLIPSHLSLSCTALQHVHPRCLERWQRSVQKLGNANDERLYICGVCRTPYTVGPPR